MNHKYDTIHKEIGKKFGDTFAEEMKAFKQMIMEARRKLEGLTLADGEDGKTKDVTIFITEIQEMNRVYNRWEDQLK